MDTCTTITLGGLLLASWVFYGVLYNLFWHPLARFPGPRLAAVTFLYRAYIDCSASKSYIHTLEQLHKQYGDVVRVGPNELHFKSSKAYLDIYNLNNRWDKEESLYHSFGEDRSSFGFLTYREAKERKDVLGRSFSKKAIQDSHAIVESKVLELCKSFEQNRSTAIDLFYAFRCMSIDVITYLCFAKSIDAINSPGYNAPFIIAMDASLGAFVLFKHSSLYKNMIMKCPPNLSKIISPATAGLVDLQLLLKQQITEITNDPSQLEKLPHKTTVYHELLRPDAYRSGTVPCAGSLYEESQALMFGGADTTGTTLMHGSFCILSSPAIKKRLQDELRAAWPSLDIVPKWSDFEKLPYLTAVIKESLRISPGVASPLPRVVPKSGAIIAQTAVPEGTVVSMASYFIHQDAEIFENPDEFIPDRWLGDKGPQLEKWLVTFSRGPRSCLGQQLAWAELYLCFAHVYRKFDIELDPSSPKQLKWKDCFLPEYIGPHLRARMTPVSS